MPELFLVLMCLADGAGWGGHCGRYVRKCLLHREGVLSSEQQYVSALGCGGEQNGRESGVCLSGAGGGIACLK